MGFALENDIGTNVWKESSASGWRWMGRECDRDQGLS